MPDEHWHLDKRLSISHLITTLGLLAGMFWWGAGVEQRIAINAQEIEHQRELMDGNVIMTQAAINEIKQQYRRIEDKLDTLVTRELEKNCPNGMTRIQ